MTKGQPISFCAPRPLCSPFFRRGDTYMMSAKFSYSFTPSPLVMYRIHATLFILSAFWGPPPPATADVIQVCPQPHSPPPQDHNPIKKFRRKQNCETFRSSSFSVSDYNSFMYSAMSCNPHLITIKVGYTVHRFCPMKTDQICKQTFYPNISTDS